MASCEVCGKKIESTRKGVRFCSSTCRSKNFRQIKRQAAEAAKLTLTLEAHQNLMTIKAHLPRTAAQIEKVIYEHGADCADAVIAACMTAASEWGKELKKRQQVSKPVQAAGD